MISTAALDRPDMEQADPAPPQVVMQIVGHSALEMTVNLYAHVDLAHRRDALNRLADLFHEDD